MTPEQQRSQDEIRFKSQVAARRLQRIVDALAEAAFLRHLGMKRAEDESEQIRAYEATLKRLDELADEEESLLIEAGILPKR